MNSTEPSNLIFFSPSSIVAIFNAATVTKEEKKIIQVRGVFRKTGTANYAGNYYNRLKDEASDSSITLITSALLHNQLEDNKTIEFNGFITRRVDKLGRIEININLIELLDQRTNTYSEEETKKIELINRKVNSGFKDMDAFIKDCLFHNRKVSITIIMGRSGIIDTDIQKAMGEAVTLYNIKYHRISLSSTTEIAQAIIQNDNDFTDILCVARGGGDNLSIFEDLGICESILERNTIIASAIGHAQDVSLFEKLADKKFITPTQFGHYLKDIYNNTIEELEQSKAKLVHDITNQLTANYSKQISNLIEQLKGTKELHEKTVQETINLHTQKVNVLTQQVNTLQQQQSQKDKLLEQANRINEDYKLQLERKSIPIIWIIVALAIGLLLGLLLKK